MATKKILLAIVILGILGVGVFAYPKKVTKPQQINQESIRQRDISEIEKFANNQDLTVEFASASQSSYDPAVPVNVYYSGSDQYELDARTGKVIQFGSRDLPIGSENEKTVDNSSRYKTEELEAMARRFIAEKAPDVNVDLLTPNHGIKSTNYFFRWENRSKKTTEGYLFIQVGFTQGGTLLNYINAF